MNNKNLLTFWIKILVMLIQNVSLVIIAVKCNLNLLLIYTTNEN